MASKWNHHVALTMMFTLCVFLPRWLPAQQSGGNQSQTGTNQSQTGQTGQSGQANDVGQITGNERFLRENREAGQMVGGSSAQGVGNMRGQTGGQGGSNFGNQGGMFGGQGGFNSMNPFSSYNSLYGAGLYSTLSRQRQQLRVPLRLGPNSFPFSPAPAAVATGPNVRLQNRLARIPQLKDRGSVKVEMEGQVAVLRGEVASQHERDLVGRLVLLEPGIADVRNELQVAPAAPPSPTP